MILPLRRTPTESSVAMLRIIKKEKLMEKIFLDQT